MIVRPAALLLATTMSSASAFAYGLPPIKVEADNRVPTCTTPGRLMAYLEIRNPQLDRRYRDIALYYMRHGERLGVRWDYAFFQMLLETGSLSYRRGDGRPGDVRPRQNNFGGLGATGDGEPGDSFRSIEQGVAAHLQHILMYAGEYIAAPIADRTRKVQSWRLLVNWQRSIGRPISFHDLAQKWVPTAKPYAFALRSISRRFYRDFCPRPDPQPELAALAREPTPAKVPSGRELARRALERARQDGDAQRSALGAPVPVIVASKPITRGETPARSASIAAADGVNRARQQPKTARRKQGAGPAQGWGGNVQHAALAPTIKPWRTAPSHNKQAAPIRKSPPKPAQNSANATLKKMISGKLVYLHTKVGATIPIKYRADGTMVGRAGSLGFWLGAPRDRGRWWVSRGKLCQQWSVWLKRKSQCLKLRKVGRIIHWSRDDGETGTARLASR